MTKETLVRVRIDTNSIDDVKPMLDEARDNHARVATIYNTRTGEGINILYLDQEMAGQKFWIDIGHSTVYAEDYIARVMTTDDDYRLLINPINRGVTTGRIFLRMPLSCLEDYVLEVIY